MEGIEYQQEESVPADNSLALAALGELADRELCRKHLLPFIIKSNPNYLPGWVHKDICKRLEKFSQDVTDKKSPRLMITVPPRHGKSEIASRTFPAWHLGKNPSHEIISCSHGSSLALSFSRKARDLCDSPLYQSIFDTRLDAEAKAVSNWLTTEGGGLI